MKSRLLCMCIAVFALLFVNAVAAESSAGAELDGARWNFPSADKMEAKLKKGSVCKSGVGKNRKTDNFTVEKNFGGKAGTRYSVTLRFRGVVEPMMYTGGTKEGEFFYIGGKPNQKSYNIYKLGISSPESHYFLNRCDKVGHKIFTIDYTSTIEIDGGAKLTLHGDGQNGKMIANFDQLTVAGVEDKPYNGQFVHVSVVKVEEVKK